MGGCSQKEPSRTTLIRSLGFSLRWRSSGSASLENGDMFLRRQQRADARQDVTLDRRKILRRLSADGVEFPDQAALFIVERNALSAAPRR